MIAESRSFFGVNDILSLESQFLPVGGFESVFISQHQIAIQSQVEHGIVSG
jgi:hypothetical protein